MAGLPSYPGSGQSRPDHSGARGGEDRKLRQVSGGDFPYDRAHRTGQLGASNMRGANHSSSNPDTLPQITPKDLEHTIWDEVAEAVGIPSSMALSSRMGHRQGMAAVPAQYTAGDDGIIDDDDLESAGKAGPWQAASKIVDFLCRMGNDVDISLDKDSDGDLEADRTWRGLVPPKERNDEDESI